SGHDAAHCFKGFSRQTQAGSVTCDNCGDSGHDAAHCFKGFSRQTDFGHQRKN
ncbi:unnamed protein product, partial [Rotaria magnacalcarata]